MGLYMWVSFKCTRCDGVGGTLTCLNQTCGVLGYELRKRVSYGVDSGITKMSQK